MRIVTTQDLLARVYTVPPTFGRVYRAGVRKNEENPLTTELYLICQDKDKRMIMAPDTLKKNMRIYLNEYRLISDAIDILDATVVNYAVNFSILCTPSSTKSTVLANTISAIKSVVDIKYYQIDQPLIEADIIPPKIIIKVPNQSIVMKGLICILTLIDC